MRIFVSRVSSLISRVIGRWQWQPPAWLTGVRDQVARGWNYFAAEGKRVAALVLILGVAAAGTLWYLNRPIPHYVTYSVTPPPLTEYNEKGISRIHPMRVVFSESAAPLQQVEKRLTSGVVISPAIAGTWFWTSDKELQFTPKDDWPIDVGYTVRFDKKNLLAAGVELERYSFDFSSQPFSARIVDSQFYQDPRDPNLKKLVATVQFSHPVDAEGFESSVSFYVAKDAEYLGLKPDSRNFTLSYDKFKLAAFVHSAALSMPRDDTPMTLRINRGVHAMRGGNDTRDRLEATVTIPGRTSLRFSGARMTLV